MKRSWNTTVAGLIAIAIGAVLIGIAVFRPESAEIAATTGAGLIAVGIGLIRARDDRAPEDGGSQSMPRTLRTDHRGPGALMLAGGALLALLMVGCNTTPGQTESLAGQGATDVKVSQGNTADISAQTVNVYFDRTPGDSIDTADPEQSASVSWMNRPAIGGAGESRTPTWGDVRVTMQPSNTGAAQATTEGTAAPENAIPVTVPVSVTGGGTANADGAVNDSEIQPTDTDAGDAPSPTDTEPEPDTES